MKLSTSLVFSALLACPLIACGGETFVDSQGADASPQPDSGSSDAHLGPDNNLPPPDAGVNTACPGAIPANGAPCGLPNLVCEYGGDPRVACNALATCNVGGWSVTPGADCSGSDPSGCPATESAVPVGGACAPFRQFCLYPQGMCGCGLVNHQSQQWQCDKPSDSACPYARPRLGSPCVGTQSCDYGACTVLGGPLLQCSKGVWAAAIAACPP